MEIIRKVVKGSLSIIVFGYKIPVKALQCFFKFVDICIRKIPRDKFFFDLNFFRGLKRKQNRKVVRNLTNDQNIFNFITIRHDYRMIY